MTYGNTNLGYPESDTPASTLPAPTSHPTIAHQTESGHHLIQWEAVVARSALYEVSTLQHPVGDDTGSQRLVLGPCHRRVPHRYQLYSNPAI